MAVVPTIPTSFVPHPGGSQPQRFRTDFSGAFGFFAYTILGIIFILALGVFFYGRILNASLESKEEALTSAEQGIDTTTVEGFVKLRNRLSLGESLLDKHIALSNFFTMLETILPSTVRFNTLRLGVEPNGVTKLEGSGVAKTFNALAVLSTAFAQQGDVKDAIFSKITVNANNTVSFNLSATLDQDLVMFAAPSVSQEAAPMPAAVPAETPAVLPTPPTP
jgi:hypothetical protein